jgi:hypothetical protein
MFIVMGTTGEYDERRVKPVAMFAEHATAERAVRHLCRAADIKAATVDNIRNLMADWTKKNPPDPKNDQWGEDRDPSWDKARDAEEKRLCEILGMSDEDMYFNLEHYYIEVMDLSTEVDYTLKPWG